MNLYQFLKTYLEELVTKKLPSIDVNELHLYYDVPIMYAYPSFLNIKKEKVTINDIMKVMAYLLTQNKYCSINFERYYEDFCIALNDFDPSYISILTPNSLYSVLKQFVEDDDWTFWQRDLITFSLRNMSENLISCANYLLNNFTNYETYIKTINNNPLKAYKQILKVRGFGEYFTKKFLNYLGCFELFNVDRLLINIFKKYDDSIVDNNSVLSFIGRQAKIASVTPYTINTMLSLVLHGRFYIHNKFIKSTRGNGNLVNNLKNALAKSINDGLLTL